MGIENALLHTGDDGPADEADAIGVYDGKTALLDLVLVETDEQRAIAGFKWQSFIVGRKGKERSARSIGVFRSSSMKWTYFESESLDDDDDQHR